MRLCYKWLILLYLHILYNGSNGINDCLIISLFLIFYIIALLLPFSLSCVCSRARCTSLETCKPFLFVENSIYFLLEELLPVGLDHDAACPFVFLTDFDLLLFVWVDPSLLFFDRRVLGLFIMWEPRVAGLKAWLFYLYFFQILEEHLLSLQLFGDVVVWNIVLSELWIIYINE